MVYASWYIRSDIFLANANEKSIGYFSEPLFNRYRKFLTFVFFLLIIASLNCNFISYRYL